MARSLLMIAHVASRTRRMLAAVLSAVLASVLAAMVLLEVVDVIVRAGVAGGLHWAPECTVLMLQTLGWLGAARLWLDHEHLTLELYGDRVPLLRCGVRHASDLLMLVGSLWLLPKVVETRLVYEAISMTSLPVSAGIRYLPPLAGVALLGVAAMLNLLCVDRPAGPPAR